MHWDFELRLTVCVWLNEHYMLYLISLHMAPISCSTPEVLKSTLTQVILTELET